MDRVYKREYHPTVADARPVTTVWMRGKNKDKQDGIYCCECGYFVPLFYDYYYDVNDLKNDYMYCPHCGRKAERS